MQNNYKQNSYNKNDNKTETQINAFASYHPVVNLLYFIAVLAITVLSMHPIYLLISLFGAFCYSWYIDGRKILGVTLFGIVPMMLLVMIINPLTHHGGIIVLGYLPSGNPLTLESILYGCSAGILMVAVMLWFRCYTAVMTSEKFVYLFGKILPALSLILSMSLRFVPMFYHQLVQIRETQKGIGRDITDGALIDKVRHGIGIVSILLTWALEHAIETADSMKSRGYGLSGRTAFSIYRFEKRDKALIIWIVICLCYIAFIAFSGEFAWQYYPMIKGILLSVKALSGYLCFLALCLTPTYLGKREDRIWEHLLKDCPSEI